MFHSAEEILGTLTPDLANLIHEVVSTAPTEQYEQVPVLKDIAAALLRVSRTGGDVPEAVMLEGPTLHYLFHTLTLVRWADAEKEVHLRRAKALEDVIRGIWARGVPSHLVQVMRETETSSARRAREKAAEVTTNRLVDRAFRVLRASGEEQQGYADGDKSTTTEYSNSTEEEDLLSRDGIDARREEYLVKQEGQEANELSDHVRYPEDAEGVHGSDACRRPEFPTASQSFERASERRRGIY